LYHTVVAEFLFLDVERLADETRKETGIVTTKGKTLFVNALGSKMSWRVASVPNSTFYNLPDFSDGKPKS